MKGISVVSYPTLKVVRVLKSHGLKIDGLVEAQFYAFFIVAFCRTKWSASCLCRIIPRERVRGSFSIRRYLGPRVRLTVVGYVNTTTIDWVQESTGNFLTSRLTTATSLEKILSRGIILLPIFMYVPYILYIIFISTNNAQCIFLF
jgi:hypothetical protein